MINSNLKNFIYFEKENEKLFPCTKINETHYKLIKAENNDNCILFSFSNDDNYMKCSKSKKLVLSDSADFINFVNSIGGRIYSYGFFYRMTCPTHIKTDNEEDYDPSDNVIIISE